MMHKGHSSIYPKIWCRKAQPCYIILLKLHCLYVFFNYGVGIKSGRCLRASGLLFGYWREVLAQVGQHTELY